MAEPFLAELRLMSFVFPPAGWALCNGQLLPINTNQALFALLGTTYGGNGQTNFALPDLRGRVPIHRGAGWVEGQRFGEEFHTLTHSELPTHTHALTASALAGNSRAPGMLAAAPNAYRPAPSSPSNGDFTTIHPDTVATVGGSQAHENRPPHLVLSWCIAIQGIFPSQT